MAIATSTTLTSLLRNTPNIQPDTLRQTFNITTIAAAGTTQATATAIGREAPFVLISNNTAANGVVLPTAVSAGTMITVYPQLATNAPLVYPPLGGTINNGTVNAGLAHTARIAIDYIAVDSTGLNYVTRGL